MTCAAIDVARLLGAESVTLVGGSFAYPDGKPYARGTYLYRYYQTRSQRHRPVSSEMADLSFRDPGLRRSGVETG